MKKISLSVFVTLLFASAIGQHISKITLGETGNLTAISFDLDESVVVNLSQDGSIIDWGVDIYRGRGENWRNKLEDYTGKVEYYKENDNEAFRGKIKFIGRTLITYYASYDDETQRGKIKSIGPINFEYYPKYENEAYKGRLKSAGSVTFSYFQAFGNDPNSGKLKGVGSTALTYYGPFDDKSYKGKIKSIGSASYIYYSSSETKELRGRLKSGSQIQPVNGIKFFVKM